MLVFMLSSLAVLIYVCHASPFNERQATVMEVINELNVLFVAYSSLQLLYSSHDAIMMYEVGNMMIFVIAVGIILNVLVIIITLS